eukprot:scaffold96002_cov63-Phaeocystis_antarctica.AAC.2
MRRSASGASLGVALAAETRTGCVGARCAFTGRLRALRTALFSQLFVRGRYFRINHQVQAVRPVSRLNSQPWKQKGEENDPCVRSV